MVSGFPLANRREARKLGLLREQSSEVRPHSRREWETLTALPIEGATQAPVIWAEAERERRSPLERNERVCGECPTYMLILGKFEIFKIGTFSS